MMKNKTLWMTLIFLLVGALALAACGGGEETASGDCGSSTGEAEQEGNYQIPTAVEGCYNVAFVYVGYMMMVVGHRHMTWAVNTSRIT